MQPSTRTQSFYAHQIQAACSQLAQLRQSFSPTVCDSQTRQTPLDTKPSPLPSRCAIYSHH